MAPTADQAVVGPDKAGVDAKTGHEAAGSQYFYDVLIYHGFGVNPLLFMLNTSIRHNYTKHRGTVTGNKSTQEQQYTQLWVDMA